ncbi:MAG: glycosyltransferase family 2 protein [Qingshengfaniella sp.]
MIDDGSTDDTVAQVAAFPEVRLIRQSHNGGKSRAMAAGLRAARGHVLSRWGRGRPADRFAPLLPLIFSRRGLALGWPGSRAFRRLPCGWPAPRIYPRNQTLSPEEPWPIFTKPCVHLFPRRRTRSF